MLNTILKILYRPNICWPDTVEHTIVGALLTVSVVDQGRTNLKDTGRLQAVGWLLVAARFKDGLIQK